MPKNWSINTLYKRLVAYLDEQGYTGDVPIADVLGQMEHDIVVKATGADSDR